MSSELRWRLKADSNWREEWREQVERERRADENLDRLVWFCVGIVAGAILAYGLSLYWMGL